MTDEHAEPVKPVYPPVDATKGIPPITPYNVWTWTTPVIPQFYWNVYSAEQRIRQICTEIGKIQAYLSYFASNSNAAHWYLDERFTETETRLTKRIDELEAELKTEVEKLNERIDEERKRAQTAESTLQTNIDNEADERKSSDTALSDKIDAETHRATTAENTIQKNVDAETERAQTAESTLQSNIDNEADERKSSDTALSDKIDAETSRATTAENTIQKNVDAETERAQAAESTLQSNIGTETANRKTADNELESTIRANKNSSDEADKRLQDSLDTEISNRKNSDNALGERVDTEAATRAQAVSNLEALISTETSNRTTADTLLTQQVNRRVKSTNVTAAADSHITVSATVSDTEPDSTTVVIGDTFAPDFEKLETNIESEIVRATSAETELNGKITHETTDRENADNLMNQEIALRLKATGVIAGDNITVQTDPDNSTVTISAQAGFTGVEHDTTMTGTGTTESPLGVDTSNIATTEALTTETTERKTAITAIEKTLSTKLESKNLVGGLNVEGYYPVPESNLVIVENGTELDFYAFMHVIHDETLIGEGNDMRTLQINTDWLNQRIADKTTSKLEATDLIAGDNITLTTTEGKVTIASTASGGLSAITHDASLSGDGTTNSPLSVVTTNFATATALTSEITNRKNADASLESRISDNESNIETLQSLANNIQFDWLEFTGATTSTTYRRRFYASAPCINSLSTFQEQAGNPLGAIYISAAGAALVSTEVNTIKLHTPGFLDASYDLSQNMLLHFMSTKSVTGYSWPIDPDPYIEADETGTTIEFTPTSDGGKSEVPVGTYFMTMMLRV